MAGLKLGMERRIRSRILEHCMILTKSSDYEHAEDCSPHPSTQGPSFSIYRRVNAPKFIHCFGLIGCCSGRRTCLFPWRRCRI